jgi:hypothetical protein
MNATLPGPWVRGDLRDYSLPTLYTCAMDENRRAFAGSAGTVGVIAVTFAAIIASRPGALSRNPLFIACVAVAVAASVILLVALYPDLRDWLRPATAGRGSAVGAPGQAGTRTADLPAAAASHVQPSATATAATRAQQATSADPVPGTAPASRANGIPTPASAGRRVARKMAEAYKAMAADTERPAYDRMEAAEKATLLSPEVGAEAYKAIASNTRTSRWGRGATPANRLEAAEKASLLSPKVGAEAYKAIASDRSLHLLTCRKAAERACELSPEIGAAALRAIAKNPHAY